MISGSILRHFFIGRRVSCLHFVKKSTAHYNTANRRDEEIFKEEFRFKGIHLDDPDKLMEDDSLLDTPNIEYPFRNVIKPSERKPIHGHNLFVVQPWDKHEYYDLHTSGELQLSECIALGNTIRNWRVVGHKLVFGKLLNRKQIFADQKFEEIKGEVMSVPGVSAVFMGIEQISGIQLQTLETEFRLPVYDRFTVVLNIFRQHARTKESKIQIALAELPYIRSHLRQIHDSTDYSSTAESLKMLIGGMGESYYHKRLEILSRREVKLKRLLRDLRSHRELMKKSRRSRELPTVSIVGYTNSGKTSIIKNLTNDEKLIPKDKLFATLDITVHSASLPSTKQVLYVDTVGFISRIPYALVEAFAETLREVTHSSLIVHVLDVNHPDHRLQYETVIKALNQLKVPKKLMDSRLTVGNKIDLVKDVSQLPKELTTCNLFISSLKGRNLNKLVDLIDMRLKGNLDHDEFYFRVKTGDIKYRWLRKNATITSMKVDEVDANYLICQAILSPASVGKYYNLFNLEGVLTNQEAFTRKPDIYGEPDEDY